MMTNTLNGIFLALLLTTPVFAADGTILASGTFVKKAKSLSGSFTITEEHGKKTLLLHKDFKAKSGPDLKVVFSHIPFKQTNGKNALKGDHLILAPLESNKGTQSYPLPNDFDLSRFQSLLIHCEKYAVLWGGSAL